MKRVILSILLVLLLAALLILVNSMVDGWQAVSKYLRELPQDEQAYVLENIHVAISSSRTSALGAGIVFVNPRFLAEMGAKVAAAMIAHEACHLLQLRQGRQDDYPTPTPLEIECLAHEVIVLQNIGGPEWRINQLLWADGKHWDKTGDGKFTIADW